MSRKTRLITAFTVLAITLSILGVARISNAQSGAIKLKLWHAWRGTEANLLNVWIADFQKANPDVVVDARLIEGDFRAQYEAALRTESGPDLFIGPAVWVGELAKSGRVAALDSRIDKAFHEQASDLSWQNVTFNGGVYAVPESNQGLVLYYNASLMDAAKLPSTVTDLLAQPETVSMSYDFYTTAGIFLGAGGKLLSSSGNNALGGDTTFLDYLSFLKERYAAFRKTVPTTERLPIVSDDDFRQGKQPFLIDGSWKITDLRYYLKDKLQIAPLPTLKNGKAWSPFVMSQAFYVSANAINPEAALRFIRYATSTAAQSQAAQIGGQVPANPQAKIDDALLAAAAKQFEAGTPTPVQPELSLYWRYLDQAVFAVTGGDQPADQVAKDTSQVIDAALSALRSPATPSR